MTGKPRIVLGLMGFGPEGSPGARITGLDEFKKALDIFQNRGYNEVDTARLYIGGLQEGFTREAGWKERGFSIATKVWPVPPGSHAPEALEKTFETSLKELGTDCVDASSPSWPHSSRVAPGANESDRSVPFADTLEAVDRLHKAGKFKRLGLSNYAAFEVAEIVTTCRYRGWVRPTMYQGVYNCILRTVEDELIPICRRYGITFDAYSPTGGGFLAGKIKSKDDDPTEGRYARGPMSGWLRGRYFRDGIIDGVQLIRAAAEERGLGAIEVAMRWLVHHSKLKIVDGTDGIVVAGSSLRQIEENLDYLEKGPLPDDLVEVLERAWKMAKGDVEPYYQAPLEYAYDTQEVLFRPGSK
ncbi:hypothetical protein DL768_009516 [Monosporascus sp. mg162]|nr:hypothetical protein DL768_009516 [Monosporascus sp. mg162]